MCDHRRRHPVRLVLAGFPGDRLRLEIGQVAGHPAPAGFQGGQQAGGPCHRVTLAPVSSLGWPARDPNGPLNAESGQHFGDQADIGRPRLEPLDTDLAGPDVGGELHGPHRPCVRGHPARHVGNQRDGPVRCQAGGDDAGLVAFAAVGGVDADHDLDGPWRCSRESPVFNPRRLDQTALWRARGA